MRINASKALATIKTVASPLERIKRLQRCTNTISEQKPYHGMQFQNISLPLLILKEYDRPIFDPVE